MIETADLAAMMREQHELQVRLGGSDPRTRTPEQQMAYVTEMVLACTDELHEALGETGWKTWSSSNHINRDAFVSELIDAFQFLMNLFTLADCDAHEIRRKLVRKHLINYRRLEEGYTGLDKCPVCHRALDDVHVTCTAERCGLRSESTIMGAHT